MMNELSAVHQRVQAIEARGGRRSKSASTVALGGFGGVKPTLVAEGDASVSWTHASVARHVPAGARGVVLSVELRSGLGSGAPMTLYTVEAKEDSSVSARRLLKLQTAVDHLASGWAIVPVGTSRSFQYQVTTDGADPALFTITLQGFLY